MPSQTLTSYKNGMHRLVDGPDWDDVRDATDSDDVTIGGLLYTEGLKWASTTWIVARTFLTFQIPSIPPNNIITSASLKFYTLLYTSPARVIAGTRSDPENNITVGDYNQVNFNTAYSDVVDGSNPNFTLNSTGIDYLNSKTGTNAELITVQETDYSDTEPANNGHRAYFYGATSEDYYPRLTINYGMKVGVGTTHAGKGTIHVGSNAKIII
mgnify:CR=1 FL=1|tara:strand:+ start:1169 stop:1804 length:636 start_codon:yes stop_codon:yes gene_type:complete